MNNNTVVLAAILLSSATNIAHAKDNLGDSTPVPIKTSYSLRGDAQILETRAHKLTFDGAYGSTPAELIDAKDGFCYVEQVEKSTPTEELKLEIKNGKYLIYGTKDGENPAITGLKGTVACAIYKNAVSADVFQIGDPKGSISCNPSGCVNSAVVDYGEVASTSITLTPELYCPPSEFKKDCIKERFTFEETDGSNRVGTTNKVAASRVEPGNEVRTGRMTMKSFNTANMHVHTEDKHYTLNLIVREPELNFTCNGGTNCTVDKLVNYGVQPTAQVRISSSFKHCVGCSVKFSKLSGNIDVHGTNASQVFSVTRDKHAVGTTTKEAVIRADLIDLNGRIMKTIDRPLKLTARVKSPVLNVSCNPGSCSRSTTKNYGTTATSRVNVYGSSSSCTGCSVHFSQISGSGLSGSGGSRYITYSRGGTSPGAYTKVTKARVQLKNSAGKVIKTIDKTLRAGATVKPKPRVFKWMHAGTESYGRYPSGVKLGSLCGHSQVGQKRTGGGNDCKRVCRRSSCKANQYSTECDSYDVYKCVDLSKPTWLMVGTTTNRRLQGATAGSGCSASQVGQTRIGSGLNCSRECRHGSCKAHQWITVCDNYELLKCSKG